MSALSGEPTLGEIARALHRIEASLKEVTGDHEVRLRKVEKWMYAVPPAIVLAVTSVVATVAGAK